MSGSPIHLVLAMAVALSGSLARGQDSQGPGPKKPRILEDYQASTLKEIVAIDADEEKLPKGSRASKYSDLIPFKVSVVYTRLSRPISRKSKDALFRWAQCCAGNPDQFTGPFDTEMRFAENGVAYWLAIRKKSLPDFEKELQKGQTVNLYLIRVAARRSSGQPGAALLVERFRTASESSHLPATGDPGPGGIAAGSCE